LPALFAGGLLNAPLIACGILKIAYDVALLASFRRLKVPLDQEDRRSAPTPVLGNLLPALFLL
jgi:hypothetical protein